MTVDDRKFYEKWDEYHHLRIKELFEEAEVETAAGTGSIVHSWQSLQRRWLKWQ
jgi:hypothetical protein